jgi:hypothetical protein
MRTDPGSLVRAVCDAEAYFAAAVESEPFSARG